MAGNLFPRPTSLYEMAGSGKMKFGEESAGGTRIAFCDSADLFKSIQFLMGYVFKDMSGNEIKVGADIWPGVPALRCSAVDVEPYGEFKNSNWDEGPLYTKQKLTITYDTPKWDEGSDDSSDNPIPDITFMTQQVDYSCETMVVPMKVGTGAVADRKTVNRHIRLPMISYTLTLPRVRFPPWNTFNDLVGKVNSNPMFGGATETVLFDGPSVGRTVTLLGDKSWQVVLKLVYNRHGWNKTLNPETLVWENARDVKNGNQPPYELGDLTSLFS